MKTVVDPAMRVAELRRWRGASAEVWMFHVTHRRLAIRLSRRDEPDVLYLVAVACEHIVGPFSWDLGEIAVFEEEGRERITDLKAGFALRCSSVTLVKGTSTDYDTSFDDFMGESAETSR